MTENYLLFKCPTNTRIYTHTHTHTKRELNKHFKLLFFKLNSHFGTSNLISTCRNLSLLLIKSKQYLFGRLFSRNKKKTKVHYKFIELYLKKKTHKPPKAAAAKNLSSSVYVIDATCFDECFLFRFYSI